MIHRIRNCYFTIAESFCGKEGTTMKKNDLFAWTRLLRTVVALLVILSMLLCGCTNADNDDGTDGKKEEQTGGLFGDGDGKLEAQDAVDSLTNLYGALLSAMGGNQADRYGYEMDLMVTLGEEVLNGVSESFVQSGLNGDASWLREIGLHMEMNYNGDLMQTMVDANLAGKPIASADVIMDMAGNMAYIGVPELNDRYFGGEVDFSQMQSSTAMLEEYAALVKDLPTDKELNALLTRYLNLVLEMVNEPTGGETQLSTGGITKNVATTTYAFTKHNVLDIATQILTTAKTDAELEKVLDAFSKVINQHGAKQAVEQEYIWTDVDLHAQMLESIDPALEEIQDTKANTVDQVFAELVIYTDGQETAGCSLSTIPDGSDADTAKMDVLHIYALRDGKETALYVNYIDQLQLAGTGRISGSKLSGDYTLSANGQKLLDLQLEDFNLKALKKGELEGTVRLRFGEVLLESMGDSLPVSEDLMIELELDIDDKQAEINCNLYSADTLGIAIVLTGRTTSGANIRIPSDFADAMDSDAMDAWVEEMDYEKVLSNLLAAGVPTDMVDMLRQSIENALSGGDDPYGDPYYPSYGY